MRRFLFGIALLGVPLAAHAQWYAQPNGDYAYNFSYTTGGAFSCVNPQYLSGTCATSANTLTLGNGAATATIAFTGASSTATASNIRGGNLALGTFTLTYGGTGGFTWPTISAGGNHEFDFALSFTETGPVVATRTLHQGFLRQSPTVMANACCEQFGTYFQIPASPSPVPLNYAVLLDSFTRPDFIVGGATQYQLIGQVGLVPEPSTYALMAAGLLVLGLARWRRV
jgi:hypothetical protein